jgi:hypothetical protein
LFKISNPDKAVINRTNENLAFTSNQRVRVAKAENNKLHRKLCSPSYPQTMHNKDKQALTEQQQHQQHKKEEENFHFGKTISARIFFSKKESKVSPLYEHPMASWQWLLN